MDIDMKELWPWFIGAGASIGVFWRQILNAIGYLRSMIIMTVQVQGGTETPVIMYLKQNHKHTKIGVQKLRSMFTYIRKNNDYGQIGIEMVLDTTTIFWNGPFPFLASKSQSKDKDTANADEGFTLSFLRGTLDFKSVLVNACANYNKAQTDTNSDRYQVRRYFGGYGGKKKKDTVEGPDDSSDKFETQLESSGTIRETWYTRDPLGMEKSDLGQPLPEHPFDNYAFSKTSLEFIDYLDRWYKSKDWYKAREIPWRVGTLLYGPPGTGKTSYVRCLAQKYKVPVCIVDLTTMSNQALVGAWNDIKSMAPCIVLFEDLDRVFDEDLHIKQDSWFRPVLTLDALLNCISGLENSDGIMVFATANDTSKLDPALGASKEGEQSTRPGRLDWSLEFTALDHAGREKVANKILLGETFEEIQKIVVEGKGDTGAQFVQRCSDRALKLYWNSKAPENTDTQPLKEVVNQ